MECGEEIRAGLNFGISLCQFVLFLRYYAGSYLYSVAVFNRDRSSVRDSRRELRGTQSQPSPH